MWIVFERLALLPARAFLQLRETLTVEALYQYNIFCTSTGNNVLKIQFAHPMSTARSELPNEGKFYLKFYHDLIFT